QPHHRIRAPGGGAGAAGRLRRPRPRGRPARRRDAAGGLPPVRVRRPRPRQRRVLRPARLRRRRAGPADDPPQITSLMHTFVIGGTGFLGAALVRRLLEAGHHVTTFSRGRAGLAPAHPRLEAVYGDRHDVAALEAATAGRTFDAVFDLAAYTPEAS